MIHACPMDAVSVAWLVLKLSITNLPDCLRNDVGVNVVVKLAHSFLSLHALRSHAHT